MSVRRLARAVTVALVAAVAILGAGCGKKGPPLAPLRPVPARVEDLTVRRLGDEVYLRFTIPSKNADNTTPASLVRMEAYAVTGRPEDPSGRPLDAREFTRYGALVGAMEVEPPPPPPPDEGPAPAPPPPDPRPAQGERVTLVEKLAPPAYTPFVHPKQKEVAERRAKAAADAVTVEVPQPLAPPREEVLGRVYVVTGRSKQNQAGPLSARLLVPLAGEPEAPAAPVVRHDEARIYLEWTAPPSARRRMQEPASPAPASAGPAAPAGPPGATAAGAPPVPAAPAAGPGGPASAAPVDLPPLPARPVFAGAIPHTYNVYEHSEGPAEGVTMPTPLNPAPLDRLTFEDTRLAFGVQRCYVLRMVEARGNVTVESAPSPPTCVTPRDTFPPAAPRGLAAVAGEGAVSLIWEPNAEADFAGYVVLRGEAPGEKLEAITPTPIRETTYRDGAVTAGVRYVYAIVAVDNAVPQNVSVESNRVEETAR